MLIDIFIFVFLIGSCFFLYNLSKRDYKQYKQYGFVNEKPINFKGVIYDRQKLMAHTAIKEEFLNWEYRYLVNNEHQSAAMKITMGEKTNKMYDFYIHEEPDKFCVVIFPQGSLQK